MVLLILIASLTGSTVTWKTNIWGCLWGSFSVWLFTSQGLSINGGSTIPCACIMDWMQESKLSTNVLAHNHVISINGRSTLSCVFIMDWMQESKLSTRDLNCLLPNYRFNMTNSKISPPWCILPWEGLIMKPSFLNAFCCDFHQSREKGNYYTNIEFL